MSSLAIHHALVLTKNLFDADGVMFYWVNEQQQTASITDSINISQEFIDQYHNGMQDIDPLNVKNFLKSKNTFNSLENCSNRQNQQEISVYQDYISSHGIHETFDILFWKNDHAYAGIGVTNPNLKTIHREEIQALHFFLEQNLLCLQPIQKNIIFNYLEEFKLTFREKEVCLYLLKGFNNAEIAKNMKITVGTVKSNLNRILSKLGLNCRLQVAQILNELFSSTNFQA